jgi:hypothetical protein
VFLRTKQQHGSAFGKLLESAARNSLGSGDSFDVLEFVDDNEHPLRTRERDDYTEQVFRDPEDVFAEGCQRERLLKGRLQSDAQARGDVG